MCHCYSEVSALLSLSIVSPSLTKNFRLLSNVSSSLYLTQQLMGLAFVLMFIYTGFAITHEQMHPWVSVKT
jgi:hypothetical protein